MKPIISATIIGSSLAVMSQQHLGDPVLVGIRFEPWKRPTSHQRVQDAESVGMEGSKALNVPVLHLQSRQISQRVQVGVAVVSLMNHTVLFVLPSILTQEPL